MYYAKEEKNSNLLSALLPILFLQVREMPHTVELIQVLHRA